ncbi:MAG TPA: hypothetical protein ENG70_00065 [Candidatus Cloacimonetes bacterium]|nr:hypothetical protein [Candidatus Cloacimonadota bacterium]HEX37250.1 hypothetical protein [Candidatus Cloacimonadota bacterium]
MNTKKVTILLVLVLLVNSIIYAQKFQPHPMGKHKELITQYRDLEMLKALDLSQEESKVALPIIKDIDKNRESFYENQNNVLNEIEKSLSDNNMKELSKNVDKFIEVQKNFEKDRLELFKKLRKNLPEEKFARYILFMRQFGRNLQEKIHHMMGEKNKMEKLHPQKP